jgi:hypothetical protein
MLLLGAGWLAVTIWLWRKELRGEELPARLPAALNFGVAVLAIAAFVNYLLPLSGFQLAFPIDDSYITLSAARNLAEKNLFAVNPAAPLAGITSPLHVLLVGLFGKLIGVVWADRMLGLAAFVAVGLGTLAWTRKLGGSQATASLAAGLTILGGPLVFGALNGLETDLFAALLIWTFVAFEAAREKPKRWLLVGLFTGLAVLTRPEGFFLAAAVFGVGFLRAAFGREWNTALLIVAGGALAALVTAPYWIANFALTGHVMPLTVSAKKHFFAAECMPPLARVSMTIFSPVLMLGLFVVFTPLLFGAKAWWKRGYPILFLALFYGAYLVQFPGALTHYWGRYQHPLLPVVLSGLALGAAALVKWRQRAKGEGARPTKVAVVVAAVLVLTAGVAGTLQKKIYRNALETAADGGYLMQVADWVRQNTEPGELVAAHDIGVVSYFSERPVLDLVGLADPDVAAIYANTPPLCRDPMTRSRRLLDYLSERQPAIVYFHPEWDQNYMGLVAVDGGRRLQAAHHMEKKMAGVAGGSVKVHEYRFYRADWE